MNATPPAPRAATRSLPPTDRPQPSSRFADAVARAAREARRPSLLARGEGEQPAAMLLAGKPPGGQPGAAPAPSAVEAGRAAGTAQAAASAERASVAVEALALRDRGALELRLGGQETVRLEPVAGGVAIAVEASGRAPPPAAVDPAALAAAVRARGVPVVRAELRGAGARPRGGRSSSR